MKLQTPTVTVHAIISTRMGSVSLRDLIADDIPHITSYFHRPDPHIDMLIDRNQLGTPENTAKRLGNMIRSKDANQQHVAFTIYLNNRLIGYTSLSRRSSDMNYSHWHIIEKDLRAGGLSTALYPKRIKMYFDLYPIERLIHQTKVENLGVNRMLDRFVPIAETVYIDKPDGAGKPGKFHIRYVERQKLDSICDRADIL